MPKPVGGLGVLNLPLLNQALCIRWLWFKKTVMDKPWHGLKVPIHPGSMGLALTVLRCQVGNGNQTMIEGRSIAQIDPYFAL